MTNLGKLYSFYHCFARLSTLPPVFQTTLALEFRFCLNRDKGNHCEMTKLREQVETLLAKEMDRKEFLKYGGLIVLSMLGITGILRALIKETDSHSTTVQTPSSHGYGSSRYGQ